jgi:cell division protease FtsH
MREDISSKTLAQMTPGFTGAEIENMVNIGIINAVEKNQGEIEKSDFEEARDRVVMGIKKRVPKKNIKGLIQTAIHEAGHAIVCYKHIECNKKLHKVSIIPRGTRKGTTSTLADDNFQGTKEEFSTMIDMSLGGFIAEELYFGKDKTSTGCGNDLSRATGLAKGMVTKYAMNKIFGYMVVEDKGEVSHKISDSTRNELDTAAEQIIQESNSRVTKLIQDNIDDLKNLAQKLVEYEELSKEDLDAIIRDKSDELPRDKKRRVDMKTSTLTIPTAL